MDRWVSTERSARVCALLGACVIAWSSIFVELSHAAPSTTAFFRCAYALPVLLALAIWEGRRYGTRPWSDRIPGLIAGAFMGVDLVLWSHAIDDVGAGMATVLANIQVVFVPLAAWLFLAERPGRAVLRAIPFTLIGVLLISGVVGNGAYGRDPGAGAVYGACAGLAYVGALLYLRRGGVDLRRPAGPLLDLTFVAMVVAAVLGIIWGDINFDPVFPGAWWLIVLGLSSQVMGWLLITMSLPRLPAALTSLLLMVQPVGSMILGTVIFAAVPSVLQISGVVLLLGAVIYATRPSAHVHPEPLADVVAIDSGE